MFGHMLPAIFVVSISIDGLCKPLRPQYNLLSVPMVASCVTGMECPLARWSGACRLRSLCIKRWGPLKPALQKRPYPCCRLLDDSLPGPHRPHCRCQRLVLQLLHVRIAMTAGGKPLSCSVQPPRMLTMTQGRAQQLLFTGGHPGGGLRTRSEAAAMLEYAQQITQGGLPSSAVILEEASTSTRTNALLSIPIMVEHGCASRSCISMVL